MSSGQNSDEGAWQRGVMGWTHEWEEEPTSTPCAVSVGGVGVGPIRSDLWGNVGAIPATIGLQVPQHVLAQQLDTPAAAGHTTQPSALQRHACTFPGCHKAYKTKGNLARHLKNHSIGIQHWCVLEECSRIYNGLGKPFPRRDHFVAHLEKVHKIDHEIAKSWAGSRGAVDPNALAAIMQDEGQRAATDNSTGPAA